MDGASAAVAVATTTSDGLGRRCSLDVQYNPMETLCQLFCNDMSWYYCAHRAQHNMEIARRLDWLPQCVARHLVSSQQLWRAQGTSTFEVNVRMFQK